MTICLLIRGSLVRAQPQEQSPACPRGFLHFMEFYIYILYSETYDIYYVGYSDDFRRRFEQHNHSQNVTFTSKHRPWILKTVYSCGTKQSEAMKIEKFIKNQKVY